MQNCKRLIKVACYGLLCWPGLQKEIKSRTTAKSPDGCSKSGAGVVRKWDSSLYYRYDCQELEIQQVWRFGSWHLFYKGSLVCIQEIFIEGIESRTGSIPRSPWRTLPPATRAVHVQRLATPSVHLLNLLFCLFLPCALHHQSIAIPHTFIVPN